MTFSQQQKHISMSSAYKRNINEQYNLVVNKELIHLYTIKEETAQMRCLKHYTMSSKLGGEGRSNFRSSLQSLRNSSIYVGNFFRSLISPSFGNEKMERKIIERF